MRLRPLMFIVALLAAGCHEDVSSSGQGDTDSDTDTDTDTGTDDAHPDAGSSPDGGPIDSPDDGNTSSPGGGTTMPPDGGPAGSCATPSLGTITGWSQHQRNASGGFDRIDAELVWSLASTDDCVDHYVPSGTITKTTANHAGEWTTPAGTIAPTDGELVIDRSTARATYTMRGTTSGRLWADQHGSFNGKVIAGGAVAVYDRVAW